MAAQNKNSRKCEGLWQKILSPFRMRPIAHQSQPSISITNDKKPVHQPSLSKRVPIEFDQQQQKPGFADKRKKKGRNFAEREIIIVNGQNLAKPKSKKDDHDLNHEKKFSSYIDKVKDRMMKTASRVGGGAGGGSGGAGGGSGSAGGGGAMAKRDSFNDKATNFINRARFKIRATTSVQDERNISFK